MKKCKRCEKYKKTTSHGICNKCLQKGTLTKKEMIEKNQPVIDKILKD